MGLREIDTASVSVIMLALEHHLKSILCTGGPSRRQKRRLPVPVILQYLEMEENREILDHNRPGVIDSSDLRIMMPCNTGITNLGSRQHLFMEDVYIQPVLMTSQVIPKKEEEKGKNEEG